MHGGNSSEMTRRLTKLPEGPGKDWSWVILYLGILSPCSFSVSCLTTPIGATEQFGIFATASIGKGRDCPCVTSSSKRSRIICSFSFADLWFPRFIMNLLSFSRSSVDSGLRGSCALLQDFFHVRPKWMSS